MITIDIYLHRDIYIEIRNGEKCLEFSVVESAITERNSCMMKSLKSLRAAFRGLML